MILIVQFHKLSMNLIAIHIRLGCLMLRLEFFYIHKIGKYTLHI